MIKEFLAKYESAIEAVEKDGEIAGKLACDSLGWKTLLRDDMWKYIDGYSHYRTTVFAHSLDMSGRMEQSVIQKVGEGQYGVWIWRVVLNSKHKQDLSFNDLAKLATASAQQRLAAVLLALSEVE